ncbi:RHODANESE-LIKE DOMAIN-CONTAINING PROTEIN 15 CHLOROPLASTIC [Salix koriyanagi]|uniref:RHODANESE-LIKE DOMAIN-CONTAINING PROTEIN 15 CHLOROPLASTIC n=1 Tax=Salix koriyanagi TaxID=2511006 RepID=A0A9Q0SMB1_9ROSI|nr:RHODANESE-LIKE DOMAIN-CONTAINING PROTEIN 15 CHLOROPLASTIC [Salix koriyanagi]
MAAKAVLCYGSSTSSITLCPVLCPQQLNKRVFFAVNSRRCSININHKSLSFRPKASSRESLEATGIPTSVPVRVAHELHQAGHRYLDVRTPDEFSAGHAAGAINIPYMYRVGSGMTKNPRFVEEVSLHFRKHDEIIVGCQLGKRSMMAAADLLAAGFVAVTDIAGGFAAWTQNGLPTDN